MEILSPLGKLHRMNKSEEERFREREKLTDSGGFVKGNEESFICGGLV